MYMALRTFVWLFMFWLGLLTGAGAGAATLSLRDAYARTTVNGVVTQGMVTLPYNWDKRHKGQSGTATFDIAFSLANTDESKVGQSVEAPVTLQAVYFLRLGTAYEVSLNGTLLERNGDLQTPNSADFGMIPRFMVLPPYLLKKDNLFHIRIKADAGRRAGVPIIVVGTDKEIQTLYKSAYFSRVTSSEVVMILSLLVGTLALALWFTQTDLNQSQNLRRDKLYLYAGLAELCWALRVGSVLVEEPVLPWFVWGSLNVMALGGWSCFMMAFCCMVAEWSQRRWTPLFLRSLWALLACGGILAFMAYAVHLPWLLTAWYGLLTVVVLVFVIFFCTATIKKPVALQVVVALALALNLAVGLRDWIVFRLTDAFGGDTLTRYSSVVFGLTLSYIVIVRFRTASTQARDLTASLANRVAQKEQELVSSYQRVEQLVRKQERDAERTRILHDMHDGVGSYITTAIRQIESGKASQVDLLKTLRESLDQLKLSIDAMNLPPGDITALLANLRYRLEPRFIDSDIELQWDVDLLPPATRLDDKTMRHLQFMVFEALSNVLQHAHASVLRIELRATSAGGAQLRVIDNGCGFNPEQAARKGLRSLRERAALIGARLVFVGSPGHTVVEILLE